MCLQNNFSFFSTTFQALIAVPSLNFFRKFKPLFVVICSSFLLHCLLTFCRPKMTANVLRLGVVAVFTTNVDTKHTLQIYEKQSYEARHPPLRQTAVSCWRSVVRVLNRFTVNGFKSFIFLSGFACRVFFIFRREGIFFNSIFS